MNGVASWFSNSDMSYDTKAQKNRPELQSGVALSTLLFDEEEETASEGQPEESNQPPSASTANDAD